MKQLRQAGLIGLSALVLSALGCGLPLKGTVSGVNLTKESSAALLQRYAAKPGSDWTTPLVHNTKLSALRRQSLPHLGDRHLLSHSRPTRTGRFNSPKYSLQSVIGSDTSSNRVDGETGFDSFYGLDGIFVDTAGQVFTYAAGTNTSPAYSFTISAYGGGSSGDTFPNAMTVVFPDNNGHNILFVCSASGKLYAVDMSNGSTLFTPAWLGVSGTDGEAVPTIVKNVAGVGYTPSPCLDYPASSSTAYKIYAVSNKGTLNRFIFNRNTDTITSHDQINMPGNHAATISSKQEYYATSPLILQDHCLIGSWKRSTSSNRSLDRGGFYAYDLSTWPSSSTPTPGFSASNLPGPILQEPSCEMDDNLVPTIGFVPTGQALMMANLTQTGSQYALSADLLVNSDSPDSGSANDLSPDNSKEITSGLQGRAVIDDNTTVTMFNSNALFKINYAAVNYDGGPDAWSQDAWDERANDTFINADTTMYCKSYLATHYVNTSTTVGNSTEDTNGKYIYNRVYPLIWSDDGDTVSLMDDTGNANNSSGSSFNTFSLDIDNPGNPPSLTSADDLTDLSDVGTQMGGAFISLGNTTPLTMTLTTSSNTASSTTSTIMYSYSP